jgi:hypothetical protein
MVNANNRPLYPGEDPVPKVQEAGWTPGPVWTGVENLAPTGIRSLFILDSSSNLNPIVITGNELGLRCGMWELSVMLNPPSKSMKYFCKVYLLTLVIRQFVCSDH